MRVDNFDNIKSGYKGGNFRDSHGGVASLQYTWFEVVHQVFLAAFSLGISNVQHSKASENSMWSNFATLVNSFIKISEIVEIDTFQEMC